MATAYTPGLKVTASTVVRKVRRLPLAGKVLVREGDPVEPDTVVARAELPGELVTVRLAELLSLEPEEAAEAAVVSEGDRVEASQVIAETSFLWGLLKPCARAPESGVIEFISPVTGHAGLRRPPRPVEVNAYVKGRISKVLGDDGVEVVTKAALVQGVFGVGGERTGRLMCVAASREDRVEVEALPSNCPDAVLVAGGSVTAETVRQAASRGAIAVVAGGITDAELTSYLGRREGLTITGSEDVPATLILTEGFGAVEMSERTFDLLHSLDGRDASVSGATQVRAGAIRPEIIVPLEGEVGEDAAAIEEEYALETELRVGSRVRIIREPNFGKTAVVTALPKELVRIGTGATVAVARCRLDGPDGTEVSVARANLELI